MLVPIAASVDDLETPTAAAEAAPGATLVVDMLGSIGTAYATVFANS